MDEQQLVDEEAINTLVDASGVTDEDVVIEIGLGTGNITAVLLERAGKVTVVEKNPKYRPVLKGRFGNDPKLETVIGDALYYRYPPVDRVVSNLPYMISEPLLHRLFRVDFKSASLIVSRGFAELVTSTDTKMGYLTWLLYDVEIVTDVHASSYLPQPKTLTSIISLQPRSPTSKADSILQAVFRQEDKKTSNALREALIQTGEASTKRVSRETIKELDLSTDLLDTPVARLSLDQIRDLSTVIETRFT